MYSQKEWPIAEDNPILEKCVVIVSKTEIKVNFGKRIEIYTIQKRVLKDNSQIIYYVSFNKKNYKIDITGLPNDGVSYTVDYYLILCSFAKDIEAYVWATGKIRRMETE